MRELAGNKFKNQTLAKNWIKQQLERIGYCESFNETDKQLFLEIIKGHPDKQEGIEDFKIRPEYKSYALFVVRNGIEESISWCCCATGRGKTNNEMLNMALRNAIDYQIKDFREHNNKCKCGNQNHLEVDHIIMFKYLVKSFNENRTIPTNFKDEGNRYIVDDEEYNNEWIKYHKDNATLQILCKDCHSVRTKSQTCKLIQLPTTNDNNEL